MIKWVHLIMNQGLLKQRLLSSNSRVSDSLNLGWGIHFAFPASFLMMLILLVQKPQFQKLCSSSLVIKEKQIQITIKYYVHWLQRLKLKRLIAANANDDMEQVGYFSTITGVPSGKTLWENIGKYLIEFNIHLPILSKFTLFHFTHENFKLTSPTWLFQECLYQLCS